MRLNIKPIKIVFTLFLLVSNISVATESACGNNNQASQLADLIRQHPQQQRASISCQKKLTQIAQYKAELLSQNEVIMHNIGRLTPNQLLRKKGYALSSGYPVIGNQVEAIAAGEKEVQATFDQLLSSKRHRQLIVGSAPFYRLQNEIGIAYLRQNNAPYEHYWVIYLADTKNRPKPELKYTVNHNEHFSQQESTQKSEQLSIRERMKKSRNSRPMRETDN